MQLYIGSLLLLVFVSIMFFVSKAMLNQNYKVALILMLALAGILRIYVNFDPFLHTYDEQFHALVAKHFMDNPLKPCLYENPVLPYDFKNWSGNHIWLSKQPLPLWMMAFSMKIFGIAAWSARFPSLIISLLSIVLTYKIGKMMYGEKVGLLAAFFHGIHGTLIEMAGGRVSSDHVDILFLFCFELGLFFTIKHVKTSGKYFPALIGVAIGMAFLCKWIASFFMVFIWLSIMLGKGLPIRKILSEFVIIIATASFMILPWQVFIYQNYPVEASWMFREIFAPVGKTIQGHEGGILYYINAIRIIFSEVIYLPMLWLVYHFYSVHNKMDVPFKSYSKGKLRESNPLPACPQEQAGSREEEFLFDFYKKTRRENLWILCSWIFIPLVLLSLAETKRFTYILISAPAFFMLSALFFFYLYSMRKQVKVNPFFVKLLLFLLLALPVRYSLERIKPFEKRPEKSMMFERWKTLLETENLTASKTILLKEPDYIQAMFYHDFIAYNYGISNMEKDSLSSEGYRIFIYNEDKNNYRE